MKLTLLLVALTCISLSAIAQKDLISKKEFTNRMNVATYSYDLMYHLKDGMGKPDSINISISKEIIDSLHLADTTILHMVNRANFTAEYSLKEKTSYEINHGEPFMLFIYTDKKGVSTITNIWYFIGQNAYGAKKSSKLFSSYDFNGNLVSKSYMD